MKKIRKVHFWIGVIVSIFLFIESTTGIIMYFNKGEERPVFSMQGQFPGTQNNDSQQPNSQSGSQLNENSSTSIANAPNFGQSPPDQSSFSVKSLHTGIIGLISGIGLFILTGTGLILSYIIWRNKRKSKTKSKKIFATI